MRLQIFNSTGPQSFSTTAVSANTWYHVVGIRSGSNAGVSQRRKRIRMPGNVNVNTTYALELVDVAMAQTERLHRRRQNI